MATKTTDETRICACGCGGSPKKGEFLPGHDARLKSQLRRAAADGSAAERAKAEKALKDRGWTPKEAQSNGAAKSSKRAAKTST
jgi:hypothetical protein